nr:MAG TPA: hypothetical protein [Caudoviricetes sp.]
MLLHSGFSFFVSARKRSCVFREYVFCLLFQSI